MGVEMKEILARIVEKARQLTPAQFAAEVAQLRRNEFAETLRAIENFNSSVSNFRNRFEIRNLSAFPDVRVEDFYSYELVSAANDERFALAA